MNPDIEYVKLCQIAYNGIPDFIAPHDARAYLGNVNGIPTLCFPGSRTLRDWALDLLAIPSLDLDSVQHAKLGLIPLGFLSATNDILPAVKHITQTKYNVCGHSLGGIMAVIFGALNDNPPNEIVTFNAPRGLTELGVNVLSDVTIRQYRFGADPVSLVLTEPFMNARNPLIQVGKPMLDIFANHHIENFIAPFSTGD